MPGSHESVAASCTMDVDFNLLDVAPEVAPVVASSDCLWVGTQFAQSWFLGNCASNRLSARPARRRRSRSITADPTTEPMLEPAIDPTREISLTPTAGLRQQHHVLRAHHRRTRRATVPRMCLQRFIVCAIESTVCASLQRIIFLRMLSTFPVCQARRCSIL